MFSTAEQGIVLALAEVATPAGRRVPAAGPELVADLERVLLRYGGAALSGYASALHVLEWAALPLKGARFSRLDASTRSTLLGQLAAQPAFQRVLRVLFAPLKSARTLAPGLHKALGAPLYDGPPPARETARWQRQLIDARTLTDGEVLEADVVVVGSGAGGATVARRLAAEGLAVIVLEEGPARDRADFAGDPLDRMMSHYRDGGVTAALGAPTIPVWMGVGVGGTTTINSGTCLTPGDEVFQRWVMDDGLSEFGRDALAPFFDRAAQTLQVAPGGDAYLGGSARVIARGAEALGLEHGPLPRNAPGCDGQGVCAFGCPTGAKRSADVALIPAALSQGAVLVHHARVVKVLLDGDRAVGVVAEVVDPGTGAYAGRRTTGAHITVRAKSVTLAGGTLPTPGLLLRQRLANRSGQVGRGLTLHPASGALAVFDEELRSWEGIPQSYGITSYQRHGITLEGVFMPLRLMAAWMPQIGPDWTELIDNFDRLASFGLMVADSGRGRVIVGPGGHPQMLYQLSDTDRRKHIAGQILLAEIYFAAGAKTVFPGVYGRFGALRNRDDLARMQRDAMREIRASDLDVSSFHPLGTCRMGRDPRSSVVGPEHETHDVPGLFVVDGSSVPGPLGANPMMTIMAFAERASGFVVRRVEKVTRQYATTTHKAPEPASSPSIEPPRIEFFENMAGEVDRFDANTGALIGNVRVTFDIRPVWDIDWPEARRRGHILCSLTGRLTIDGIHAGELTTTATPCRGTIKISPQRMRETLVYDLDGETDQGLAITIHGAKHQDMLHPTRGLSTLYTDVHVRDTRALIGRGILRFDISEWRPWLETWRIVRAGFRSGK